MTSKSAIDAFLAQRTIAVVGASRNPNKFGTAVYKDLKSKGYKVFAVNPNTQTIQGDPAYPDLLHLPEPAGGVVLVVPPAKTEEMVRQAKEAGIQNVWMQQGAESPAAIQFCQQNGMSVVAGECIMMFSSGGAFPHNLHRWFKKVTGTLPK